MDGLLQQRVLWASIMINIVYKHIHAHTHAHTYTHSCDAQRIRTDFVFRADTYTLELPPHTHCLRWHPSCGAQTQQAAFAVIVPCWPTHAHHTHAHARCVHALYVLPYRIIHTHTPAAQTHTALDLSVFVLCCAVYIDVCVCRCVRPCVCVCVYVRAWNLCLHTELLGLRAPEESPRFAQRAVKRPAGLHEMGSHEFCRYTGGCVVTA